MTTRKDRKVPDVDTLLKHRADGLSDGKIADLYGVHHSRVSYTFRDHGHGAGSGGHNRRIHADIEQLAREYYRDGGAATAARYGVSPRSVANAIGLARSKGQLPPRDGTQRKPPTPKATPNAAPKPAPKPKAERTTKPPKPKPAPKPAPVNRGYVAPDLSGLCAARELFGSRVCDLKPHGKKTPHEGEGPNDPRAEFWGARP